MSLHDGNMTGDVCGGGDEDDDDDEHFCMKCKTIIKGIENYIEHRKVKCSSNTKVGPLQTHS